MNEPCLLRSQVLLAPLVALLLALGVFSFSTIPPAVYLVILVEGLVAYLLADYLWARAILLLGPTIATLGMSVQIPMAATVELLWGRAYWYHHALVSAEYAAHYRCCTVA